MRRPSDTWDWITLADIEHAVVGAFVEACTRRATPKGVRFLEEGSPWTSREDFRDDLGALFVQRLNVLGLARGVCLPPGSSMDYLPAGVRWPDADADSWCRGSAPTLTAAPRGSADAALVMPGRNADSDSSAHGDTLSLCPIGQNLPAVVAGCNTQTAQEAVTA